jgi:hypothetical protein
MVRSDDSSLPFKDSRAQGEWVWVDGPGVECHDAQPKGDPSTHGARSLTWSGQAGQEGFPINNNKTSLPPLFSELRILKDLESFVFGTAHSKGVMGAFRGTAHSKRLRKK